MCLCQVYVHEHTTHGKPNQVPFFLLPSRVVVCSWTRSDRQTDGQTETVNTNKYPCGIQWGRVVGIKEDRGKGPLAQPPFFLFPLFLPSYRYPNSSFFLSSLYTPRLSLAVDRYNISLYPFSAPSLKQSSHSYFKTDQPTRAAYSSSH